ncbi:succinylglutamic semialdehyde dehydrogenase [Klebsiella aerogenes]|nr:succinylglutamic semialdehyde dehydrogenase [Klebsiella aerogenes]
MAVKAQFIAGQWQAGSGATMSKLAPEDQSLLWQAASAGADDVQAACAAARAAFLPLVAPAAGRAYCRGGAFCRAAGDT